MSLFGRKKRLDMVCQAALDAAYRLGFSSGARGLPNDHEENGNPSRDEPGRLWNRVYTMGYKNGTDENDLAKSQFIVLEEMVNHGTMWPK